jgi:hypothetical protein
MSNFYLEGVEDGEVETLEEVEVGYDLLFAVPLFVVSL